MIRIPKEFEAELFLIKPGLNNMISSTYQRILNIEEQSLPFGDPRKFEATDR